MTSLKSSNEAILEELREELRLKYKAEARKACEDAYEKGRNEGKEAARKLEEEARIWKSLVEATSSSMPNTTPLLKYVMEQVYREVKKEFDKDIAPDVVQRVKTCLLRSTDTLVSKLSNIVLLSEGDKRVESNRMFVQSKKPLSVHGVAIPASLYISVEIPKILILAADKMFSRGHAVYLIQSHASKHDALITLSKNSLKNSCQQERRYRDFCDLLFQLKRCHPLCTVPNLPPKSSSVGNKTLSTLEPRRRQLLLWLRYVLMHGILQRSPHVQYFVTGSSAPGYWPFECNITIDKGSAQIDVEESGMSNSENERNFFALADALQSQGAIINLEKSSAHKLLLIYHNLQQIAMKQSSNIIQSGVYALPEKTTGKYAARQKQNAKRELQTIIR